MNSGLENDVGGQTRATVAVRRRGGGGAAAVRRRGGGGAAAMGRGRDGGVAAVAGRQRPGGGWEATPQSFWRVPPVKREGGPRRREFPRS
jgi:hypothetical protein